MYLEDTLAEFYLDIGEGEMGDAITDEHLLLGDI